jgi:hypothetical protein
LLISEKIEIVISKNLGKSQKVSDFFKKPEISEEKCNFPCKKHTNIHDTCRYMHFCIYAT